VSAGHLVSRRRLIEALERGRERRLALIHAPAGYGKTTLALQWRDQLTAEGRAVAWMSVDLSDNQPVWLLAHLIEAFRAVRPGPATDLFELLEQHPDDAVRYVLPTLVNAIDESTEALVIMIDDWHRVTDPRAVDVLEFLLGQGSSLLQLVVVSRTRTGLPLGRLQVLHQVVEVDADALRFDAAESAELLRHLNGFPLADDELTGLVASTDGWVAALQLASLSLRAEPDMPRLMKGIAGKPDSLDDYLAENVLDQLPPKTLDFLLHTALPERLCADLVGALTGETRGQARLEQIESEDLFLKPLDGGRTWFRYHHLFSSALRHRLNRDHPDEVAGLHRRAALWFAAHDLTNEAVDHALAAGEPDLAVDFVENRAGPLFDESRMATLMALVAKLPPELVADRPRLQTTLGWMNVLLQRSGQALQAVEQLGRISPTSSRDADLALETRLLRSCIDVYRDQLHGVGKVTAECLEQAENWRPWLVSAAADMEAVANLRQFDFTAVRERQAWAEPFHERTTGGLTGVMGHCISALAALEELDIDATRRQLTTARDLALRVGGPNSYLEQVVSGQFGALMYELGDLAAAEAGVDRTRDISEIGLAEFLMTSHVMTARVKARRGNPKEAVRQLVQGAEVARKLNLVRLSAGVFEERARLGLPADEPPPPVPPRTGEESGWLADVVETSLVTARILRGLRGGSRAARPRVAEAHDLFTQAEAEHRPLAALRARVLLAAVLHRAGDTREAMRYLRPAVELGHRTGLVGPLTDGGAPIAELLATMSDPNRPPRLTDREQQILRLLDAGRSNQEIAEALALSANTVKWYLKTLYQKLDVTRRQECVAVARALNLLL
jgi:serine/threonine-protein kinase PknK